MNYETPTNSPTGATNENFRDMNVVSCHSLFMHPYSVRQIACRNLWLMRKT